MNCERHLASYVHMMEFEPSAAGYYEHINSYSIHKDRPNHARKSSEWVDAYQYTFTMLRIVRDYMDYMDGSQQLLSDLIL